MSNFILKFSVVVVKLVKENTYSLNVDMQEGFGEGMSEG